MREIRIRTSKEYNVFIASDISGLPFIIDNYKIKSIFIITDKNVYNTYSNLFKCFGDRVMGIKIIEPGEESKNNNTILEIYSALIEKGINKKTVIAAIGGGVVGDIAGFAASTYLRGIGLIHIPTSLVAQCNSSIGGKTGYNFGNTKNIIGTFYQPDFVYIDINFLKTLNETEFLNGVAEIIKYGFACDKSLFQFIEENKKAIKEREIDKLLHIIHECVKIKGEIIEKDEYGNDERQTLNFGHTISCAIENGSDLKISHGEAVAIGMSLEAFIAVRGGNLKENEYNRLINILKYFKLAPYKGFIDSGKLMEIMKMDKKATSNSIRLVLPDCIGHAVFVSDIKSNLIKQYISEAINRGISQ